MSKKVLFRNMQQFVKFMQQSPLLGVVLDIKRKAEDPQEIDL